MHRAVPAAEELLQVVKESTKTSEYALTAVLLTLFTAAEMP